MPSEVIVLLKKQMLRSSSVQQSLYGNVEKRVRRRVHPYATESVSSDVKKAVAMTIPIVSLLGAAVAFGRSWFTIFLTNCSVAISRMGRDGLQLSTVARSIG